MPNLTIEKLLSFCKAYDTTSVIMFVVENTTSLYLVATMLVQVLFVHQ